MCVKRPEDIKDAHPNLYAAVTGGTLQEATEEHLRVADEHPLPEQDVQNVQPGE